MIVGVSDLAAERLSDFPEHPSPEQLADACMWERHDFAIVPVVEQERRMRAMGYCWRAIWKAVNTPGRGGEFLKTKGNPNG